MESLVLTERERVNKSLAKAFSGGKGVAGQ